MKFNESQLRRGTKVEMEHTDNPAIARKIAMDHLREDKRYYQKLLRRVEGKRRSRVSFTTKEGPVSFLALGRRV
jgi:hypothetical protein